MSGRRLLLVHAHPDDESINNGATMARYVAAGAGVTLVTCTLGELGEIIPPELAMLAADRADVLGTYRIGELARACAALGVTDHRFLGGPGRWRDSGMMGLPDNDAPGAFWRADLDAAAEALTSVIREVRPQVVVGYDDNGGYGHPDHIQAHRVTRRAFERAADPRFGAGEPYRPAKLYAAASMLPELRTGLTTRIDGTAYVAAKRDAMRAHATQITVDGDLYALSNGIPQELSGVEYYTLLSGEPGPRDADGYETDLFAGIA
ncbi:MAG: N-acetyl-1-D-myo-inositol-2-amino-2-deoxy-alpha-D-glucopyranoside deacetylase [Streptosporangiales bacterium]|nr:N-acetyl-1-D-myo-inositol-2-amino-2-deoxy-alpha-D-glucopyranoside deacetylase [Streptosporangiales bacterium]